MRLPLFPIPIFVVLLSVSSLSAQVTGGALLLKNDRVLAGRVELRGEFYAVTIADQSRVSIPVDQVAHVGRDREELYQFKAKSITRWRVGDHFHFTRWCLLNDLLDQAAEHYLYVAKEAAGHPRVEQLAKELKKKLLEQPDFRAHLGLAPLEESTKTPNRWAGSNSQEAEVVSASDARSLAETAMHPQIAARFSQRIQPILMNRCSQAACHGAQSQNGLRLIEPYAQAYAKISSDNLRSVLGQVSTNDQEMSALIKYATTVHGIQRQPAISITETNLLSELGDWIRLVQNPVVPAVATSPEEQPNQAIQAARAREFVPFTPAIKLVPVSPGASPLRQVPKSNGFPAGDLPTEAEIDALDRQLKRLLGEPESSSIRPQQSLDPFDPAEFNRQSPSATP